MLAGQWLENGEALQNLVADRPSVKSQSQRLISVVDVAQRCSPVRHADRRNPLRRLRTQIHHDQADFAHLLALKSASLLGS